MTDKPRDAFVQMQWHGWLPHTKKTRHFPYVFLRRISSFYLNGISMGTRKIGQRCGLGP